MTGIPLWLRMAVLAAAMIAMLAMIVLVPG